MRVPKLTLIILIHTQRIQYILQLIPPLVSTLEQTELWKSPSHVVLYYAAVGRVLGGEEFVVAVGHFVVFSEVALVGPESAALDGGVEAASSDYYLLHLLPYLLMYPKASSPHMPSPTDPPMDLIALAG